MKTLHGRRLTRRLCGMALLLCAGCAGHNAQTRPAEQVYRNLAVLGGLPARAIEPMMQTFNRALGVECVHCHVPEQWHDESKPAFAIARNMMRMVQTLNAEHLPKNKGVSCWTCHSGQTRPARMPSEKFSAELEKWPAALANAEEGTKLTMAVYSAALGVSCDYCHIANDWQATARPAYQMVRVMNGMFEVFPQFMPASARTQCWMCHKGSTTPAR